MNIIRAIDSHRAISSRPPPPSPVSRLRLTDTLSRHRAARAGRGALLFWDRLRVDGVIERGP